MLSHWKTRGVELTKEHKKEKLRVIQKLRKESMSKLDSLRALGLTTGDMVDTEGGDYFVGRRGSSWPTDSESDRGGKEEQNQYSATYDPDREERAELAKLKELFTQQEELSKITPEYARRIEQGLNQLKQKFEQSLELSGRELVKSIIGFLLCIPMLVSPLLEVMFRLEQVPINEEFRQITRILYAISAMATTIVGILILENRIDHKKNNELYKLLETARTWFAEFGLSEIQSMAKSPVTTEVPVEELTPSSPKPLSSN